MPLKYCSVCERTHEFCDTCAGGIGRPEHAYDHTIRVGSRNLCGYCHNALKIYGKLVLHADPLICLMKDGKIIKGRNSCQTGG